jgi:tRNA threonylcarbamoyladenosine biosynthesis protein TsaE
MGPISKSNRSSNRSAAPLQTRVEQRSHKNGDGTAALVPATCETASAAETEALGARLATGLSGGDVVLLRGDLGAGKTTLARGIARALGVEGPFCSPTFTIGNRYRGTTEVVSHLDLYRVAEFAAEEPGLLEDYASGGEIALVEWPREAEAGLPDATLAITIRHGGGDRRCVEVEDLR